MEEPRPITGARVPLLERLADLEPEVPREPVPRRILDRAGVMDSVMREIARLFNTRRPHPQAGASWDAPPSWVLDYGVPDLTALSAASAADRDRYAAALAQILQTYEPRLSHIRIVLEPVPEDPARLAGALTAQLSLGTVREPVSFPLLIHAKTGALSLEPQAAGGASTAP